MVKMGNFPWSPKNFSEIGGKSETGGKCITAPGRMDAPALQCQNHRQPHRNELLVLQLVAMTT